MVGIPALSLCQRFGTEWHMCRFLMVRPCSTVPTCAVSIGFLSKSFIMFGTSVRHASCSCSGRCSLLNQSNLTGLEFRLLSAAYAERVDDLVDRLAEESRDLLHVFPGGLQLRGLLFFLHGQACGLTDR